MERYVFSGALTQDMHDALIKNPNFEPLDVLISQLDRTAITKAIEWKHEGFIRWLFIDSGAFSVHTGKATTTVEEYIDYLNSIDDDIDVFAQLDTIPGTFRKHKTAQDYVDSAEKSWENFLYMRTKLKSPNKLMPVFHFGEDFRYLDRMLEWTDESGNHLDYIGISPANDASKQDRMLYLRDIYNYIKHSCNPNVKTHLYGFTALEAMAKYPCYSADSISHRLLAGYGKIISRYFGLISISLRVRIHKFKSNKSIVDTADEYNRNLLNKEFEELGFTLEEAQKSVTARVVINILNIQYLCKTKFKYKDTNLVKPKKLFSLK